MTFKQNNLTQYIIYKKQKKKFQFTLFIKSKSGINGTENIVIICTSYYVQAIDSEPIVVKMPLV